MTAPWCGGGHRVDIVIYALALLGFSCAQNKREINFSDIWRQQFVSDDLESALQITVKLVHDGITQFAPGISNVTEWCKKELCWQQLQKKAATLWKLLPDGFKLELASKDEVDDEKKEARKIQKSDNGIAAQQKVVAIPATD